MRRLQESWSHAVDLIEYGEISLVLNTSQVRSSGPDGRTCRARAVAPGPPVLTTRAGTIAAVPGRAGLPRGPLDVSTPQEPL